MRLRFPLLVSCALTVFACSRPSDDKSATLTSNTSTPAAPAATTAAAAATTAAPTPAPTQAPAPAAAVDVIPNMKAFMGMLDGKDDSAGKALKKYAVPAKQKDDLGMYTLTGPKVTATDKSGANQCYTMESTAGVMKHTTHLCWNAAGKIVDITDKSE